MCWKKMFRVRVVQATVIDVIGELLLMMAPTPILFLQSLRPLTLGDLRSLRQRLCTFLCQPQLM